tara:strand:+ start:304 stop:567 length:264 start_codon:yes stop_codon:yes gene_type:complete
MVTLELIQFLLPLLQQVEVEVHVKEEVLEQEGLVVVERMIQTELLVLQVRDSLEQMVVVEVLTSEVEVEVELVKQETPTELDMGVME